MRAEWFCNSKDNSFRTNACKQNQTLGFHVGSSCLNAQCTIADSFIVATTSVAATII